MIGNGKGQWGQLCVCVCIDRRLNASRLVYVWLWWCITHLFHAAVGSLNDHFTEVVSNSHMVGCLWTAGVCDRPTNRGMTEQVTTVQGSQHSCHVRMCQLWFQQYSMEMRTRMYIVLSLLALVHTIHY